MQSQLRSRGPGISRRLTFNGLDAGHCVSSAPVVSRILPSAGDGFASVAAAAHGQGADSCALPRPQQIGSTSACRASGRQGRRSRTHTGGEGKDLAGYEPSRSAVVVPVAPACRAVHIPIAALWLGTPPLRGDPACVRRRFVSLTRRDEVQGQRDRCGRPWSAHIAPGVAGPPLTRLRSVA